MQMHTKTLALPWEPEWQHENETLELFCQHAPQDLYPLMHYLKEHLETVKGRAIVHTDLPYVACLRYIHMRAADQAGVVVLYFGQGRFGKGNGRLSGSQIDLTESGHNPLDMSGPAPSR